MTSGGNNFNIFFSEIIPTGDITTRIEKTFLLFSSVAVVYFLNVPICTNATASTATTLIRHWTLVRPHCGDMEFFGRRCGFYWRTVYVVTIHACTIMKCLQKQRGAVGVQ